jgi:DNA-directed RNA polymerase alpha subunit
MTNKEIKFELARIALERCTFSTSETLPESIKNLYEWIIEEPEVEEPEVEVETTDKNSLDSIDIKEVLNIVRKNQGFSSGIATMLETVFHNNNINTVGDLMRISRRDFSKYRLVGKKSICAIDDALNELGATTW